MDTVQPSRTSTSTNTVLVVLTFAQSSNISFVSQCFRFLFFNIFSLSPLISSSLYFPISSSIYLFLVGYLSLFTFSNSLYVLTSLALHFSISSPRWLCISLSLPLATPSNLPLFLMECTVKNWFHVPLMEPTGREALTRVHGARAGLWVFLKVVMQLVVDS